MNCLQKTFAFIVLGTIFASFQVQKATSISNPNQIRFHIDSAGFQNLLNKKNTYQEIYVSLANSQLSYIEKGTKYLAGYHILVTIKDSTGEQIAQKDWETFSQIDSLQQAAELASLEIAAFLLPPGNYHLEVRLTDLNSKALEIAEKPMRVPSFSDNELQISEIEFARSIQKSRTQNKFVKNSIEILPNPSRVFGIESPFVYFYSEIYNLSRSGDSPASYTRKFSIIDDRGTIIKSSEKMVQAKSTTSIWVEKINILNIVSGKYSLKLKITDNITGSVAERESEFWINNPYKIASLTQSDENDIKNFRAQIEYLVDRDELNLFDHLNLRGKIEYINNFWRTKPPEFRKEHLRRFYTAQERFSSPTLPGWKSDRGRIYIMYGPPDEVEREPASLDTRAYEIWIYQSLQKQGQVVFVFCDFGIYGNFQLIHSNLKSGEQVEIYNPAWREEIKITR